MFWISVVPAKLRRYDNVSFPCFRLSLQWHTAFSRTVDLCLGMYLVEQMLYIGFLLCKKKYSASVSNDCDIAMQRSTVRHQRLMLSGTEYTQIYLTCQTLHRHSLNTTMRIRSPAHQFSPNKSKGFEASVCCTSGWTASPGGARAYTHSRSRDQARIQRLISRICTCIASHPCFFHTGKIADSVVTC